jgi:hypothetical protein
MSQPRRRRRRRRRGGGGQPQPTESGARPAEEQAATPEGRAQGKSRRRRRRGRSGREQQGPRSLEEVVRAVRGPQPEKLTADPDGQTLEGVIGDLQSIWGVPQYPQEYRITLKVAEEKSASGSTNGRSSEPGPNGITRERAPAAPRVGPAPGSGEPVAREKAPRRRRRSRRGRRRGGASGDSQ